MCDTAVACTCHRTRTNRRPEATHPTDHLHGEDLTAAAAPIRAPLGPAGLGTSAAVQATTH
ncbi:hypothetical protein DEI95_13095 [Curtobacterium sp. MCBD17_008]|nr:hypothetical protein DEI95_13095 [Curtobacterium sp. MCBD17_008]